MAVKDGQWATMDPDEVFRRLNVKEVKKVEGLLRASAAGKQGELRNMVRYALGSNISSSRMSLTLLCNSFLTRSERYRDLLLSTSQISQLRDSSLRLSTTLKHIESLCASPKTIGTNGDGHVDVSGDNEAGEKKGRKTDAPARLKLVGAEDKEAGKSAYEPAFSKAKWDQLT
jgi:hypothetical protein